MTKMTKIGAFNLKLAKIDQNGQKRPEIVSKSKPEVTSNDLGHRLGLDWSSFGLEPFLEIKILNLVIWNFDYGFF